VAQQSPVDTYIKALLVQGDNAGEKLHQKGGSQGPYLEHIATKIHEISRPMYEWVRAWDIQYATEVIHWGRGAERDRPLLSWLDTGGNDDIKATLLAMANSVLGEVEEVPIPITRGQDFMMRDDPPKGRLFFVVDGFITFDSPVMVAGVWFRQAPEAQQTPEWRQNKINFQRQADDWQRRQLNPRKTRSEVTEAPTWDQFQGMKISPVDQAVGRAV
jgi:hypothetical protein